MVHIIAANHDWYGNIPQNLQKTTGQDFIFIKEKENLCYDKIKEINPRFVFLPHWSYVIPAEIYENFECVIFHMTDVPFGRGGSPLQNLISRGIYETKISALKCIKELDAGPVYLKKTLSLNGSAEEIYLRASKIVEEMIVEIINNNPIPIEQQGQPVCFKRRKPEESNISNLEKLEQVFDHIRMLDAEGYPKAFIEVGEFRFEFSRASLKHDKIISDVIITRKNPKNE
jgi:methionyl-tRNA formyltransferase